MWSLEALVRVLLGLPWAVMVFLLAPLGANSDCLGGSWSRFAVVCAAREEEKEEEEEEDDEEDEEEEEKQQQQRQRDT